ncbi:lipoprotein [Vibrio galatheae]|uniref:Lipoprotein n=1 Tax=Vibrio galatheae TaxID=579748 RepID=A0A0F4NGJ9_9VIBR|nr:DUF3261 domain-containing protein [Vibrio galatheae]KJY81963.1 lipoprotein [Vibrio galatheae]
MKFHLVGKIISTTLLSMVLSACTLAPHSSAPTVSITQNQQLQLPSPDSLGYAVTASQLIEATWNQGDNHRTEQLPVQLQVSGNQLVLAGFSSWGTRVLSLNYQDDKVDTEVMNGLSGVLPAPEQVLFNLMITLWPDSAWEAPLNKVRWHMVDNANSRAIFDNNGNQVIDIQYSSSDRLAGEIVFHHLTDNYTIKIKTLQFNRA